MRLRTIVVEDAAELATRAAAEISLEISRKPELSLLAATGNTPMGCYAELAARYTAGTLDTTKLRVVQLDEYLGVSDDDPRSLYRWLETSLTGPLEISQERLIRFSGDAEDAERDCREVATRITAWGGIDLSVLGLGPNGHLGFNEPPSAPDAPTRTVSLTPASLASNAPYWAGLPVPHRAVTVGMDVILNSRRVLLLVSGEHKREILRRTLHETPLPDVPATWLQTANLTVIADRAAWGNP